MINKGVMKKIVLMAGLLIMAFMLAPVQSDARPIKVGIIDCYSGPAAIFCKDCLKGFQMALEEINKKGVLGTKIELTTRDTKFKVDIGLSMAKELVMRENVDLLVGTMSSGVAMAISSYAKAEKIPFIVWLSKSQRITGEKGHRYVFSSGENTAMAGKAGAVAFARKPYIKYWIAGDDYEFGHAIANAAWSNLKKLKPEVKLIGQSWWKVGEPDLIPYIISIMAAKPDAIIFCTGGASMHNIMKAAKATGMSKKVPIWIHGATDYLVIKPLGREAPEGVISTIDYQFYYPDIPSNRAFVKAFRDAYGAPPSFMAFHGYNTAHFIAEAYRKAGAIDKEKFIDALEGLEIDSPVGKIEMRACDHQVVLPIHYGISKIVPEYDFGIATDMTTLTGDEVMPTCEEIMKARKK